MRHKNSQAIFKVVSFLTSLCPFFGSETLVKGDNQGRKNYTGLRNIAILLDLEAKHALRKTSVSIWHVSCLSFVPVLD